MFFLSSCVNILLSSGYTVSTVKTGAVISSTQISSRHFEIPALNPVPVSSQFYPTSVKLRPSGDFQNGGRGMRGEKQQGFTQVDLEFKDQAKQN